MFIVSAKLNPKKAITCVILFSLALIALILIVSRARGQARPADSAAAAPTDSQRTAYLSALGWAVDPSPTETLTFTLPSPLGETYEQYNQLQREQGFDLEAYAGRQVKRFTYPVRNHPGGQEGVQADLYVCDGVVIGGDILRAGADSFVATLEFPG